MSDTAFATDLDDDLNEESLLDEEHDEIDEEHDETEHDDTETGTNGTSKGGAPQRGLTRGAIRRIAAKAQEIDETPKRIVEITASLLGTSTGLADLTTAIMAAPRGATQPITDLNTIAEAHPMEAAVHATALGRDRLKAVWSLLVALDTSAKGTLPSALGKAGIAVARTVFDLDAAAKAEIADVATLLKKN